MKNYMKIIIAFLVFLPVFSIYSQQQNIKKEFQPITNTLKTEEFKKGIVFSLGGGTTMNESSFILAPNITWELHEHINIATGADVYFKPKNESNFTTINIIPYYVLRPSDKTMFQIGIGGMSYKSSILPVFSTKFDFEAYPKNYLGIQFKSYITNIVEGPTYLLLLLNYSIKF